MSQIINVLKERVSQSEDEEKNELYFTPKQKKVLKAIANNPHSTASEVADKAGVHPSYIPYIIERVDQGVVDNLHRLDEYLSERERMEEAEGSAVQNTGPDEQTKELMNTFGVNSTNSGHSRPTVDDHMVGPDATEFTVTKQLPVEITITFPDNGTVNKILQATPDMDNVEINNDILSENINNSSDTDSNQVSENTKQQSSEEEEETA